uniref:Putative bitesize n=1 Tax=Rhipicephalus pulchellus TaxID=72859 RepID=L7LVU9_RHIPC
MDLDLSNLTLAEREAIMQVLQRDQALRKMEERRILHLKAELQRLRKRGALRPGLDPARSCARCLSALGRILNRGALCPSCRKKVCRDCRLHEVGAPENSDQWLCVVCHKQMELKATSGQWMQDLCRRSSRRRKLNGPPVADELGRALQCAPSQHRPDHAAGRTVEHATSSRAAAPTIRQQPQRQSARGGIDGDSKTPPMTRTTPSASPDAQRAPQARLSGSHSPGVPRPDSPQSATGQDSLSSDISSAADSSATPFPASSASKPTSEGTPPLSSTACPSPPTGVRWAPLRGPLRTPIRKLPRQGSSLSSSSDSASAEGGPPGGRTLHHHQPPSSSATTTAADDSPPPVPYPRTKRQSPQRQLPPPSSPKLQDSPSPPTQQRQLLVPDSKIPLTPSLSAPASPAFRDRSRSALTVTYSSPPSVQDDGRGQTLPARKATAPELTGLERAKEVAFRRVTLGSVRMESSSTTTADDSSGSHRSSPRGRLRGRSRHSSGGSDDSNRLLPTIAIVGAEESSSVKSSADSMDRDSTHRDDELERIYSRSQTSLSSIGVSQMRSESMTSVYSAAGGGRYGTVAVTGEVLFSILYNYKSGLLEVHVRECRNLAPVDTKRNRSDPYVKVYLLPDKTKSGKRKTKVKKHTLNPVFEEVLKFRVTMSELQARTLWLSVWHSDMFGRNDFLGEVMLPLTYETLEKTEVRCFALQERFECPEVPLSYKGDILLALKYMPPDVTSRSIKQGPVRGSLHVLVKEARNLTATRSNGTSDPFCKSYLLPDRTKGSKQKTPVVKKCCNPKWNHTFVYPDVSLDELKDRCLELTIWDYDKITSNDFLGGVRLGLGTGKLYGRDVDWMDSHGEEVTLWRSMLERPNLWIDGSLLLRPSMQSKR